MISVRDGAKFIGLHQGQQGGGAKSFWEEKNDGANTFSEEKNDGADTFLGKKNDGARTFLQKKNDGAKTFYGMNSYNSHKINRKNTLAGKFRKSRCVEEITLQMIQTITVVTTI